MQSSEELDQQLQLLKRASKTKPYGFALLPVSEDGTPVLFVEKKESQARRMGKTELKTAKKKKMYTGLIYLNEGKIELQEGAKPLKSAEMKKFFKKLKSKAKARKSLIPSDITIIPSEGAGVLNDEELEAAGSNEDTSIHANPKYLEILEKLIARREDLEGELADISSLFDNVTMMFQQPDAEVSEEDQKSLTNIGSQVPAISTTLVSLQKKLQKLEELIHLNEKDALKNLGKEIRAELANAEDEVQAINTSLEGFSVSNIDDEKINISDVSTIEYILTQAKNLRSSKTVRDLNKNNKKPGFFDRIFANRYDDIIKLNGNIDKLIEKLEALFENEKNDRPVTDADEKKAKAKLNELQQTALRLSIGAKVSKADSFAEKVDLIWKPAHNQAQLEVQRFKMAVFSNPVVVTDPRFAAIKAVISGINLTITLPKISSQKDVKKAISSITSTEEYKMWSKVDDSSYFGKFSITSTIDQALSSLQSMK